MRQQRCKLMFLACQMPWLLPNWLIVCLYCNWDYSMHQKMHILEIQMRISVQILVTQCQQWVAKFVSLLTSTAVQELDGIFHFMANKFTTFFQLVDTESRYKDRQQFLTKELEGVNEVCNQAGQVMEKYDALQDLEVRWLHINVFAQTSIRATHHSALTESRLQFPD